MIRGWSDLGTLLPLSLYCTKQNFRFIQSLPLKYRLDHFHLASEADLEKEGRDQLIYSPLGQPPARPLSRPSAFHLADLQESFFPEFFSLQTHSSRRNAHRNALAFSDGVLVPSEFTRLSVEKLIGISPDRVYPAPLAVADLPKVGVRPKALPENWDPFLYYPADDYPHKNHARLFESLAQLRKNGINAVLVCTGSLLRGNALAGSANRAGVSDHFLHLGKVSRSEVAWLYQNARLVMFPSLFEGFGLPIIEAMLAGTPVACSGVTSLPEVGGDAAVYFNPFDPGQMSETIARFWSDGSERHRRIELGRHQAAKFSAKKMVERHAEIFAEILDRPDPTGLRESRGALPAVDPGLAEQLYRSTAAAEIRDAIPSREEWTTLRQRSVVIAPGKPTTEVHFFTLVLNGMPFIRQQWENFQSLAFPWHWHVIEGVAELQGDTAWSVANGGHVPEAMTDSVLSTDGTREFLDELSSLHPDRITLYRQPRRWQGKLEMVNAPLSNLPANCFLWQIDSDEFWTPDQMTQLASRLEADPARSGAMSYCRMFITPDRVLDNIGAYGNNPQAEWRRVWRYQSGDFWESHEPPRLMRKTDSTGAAVDVMSLNPFTQDELWEQGIGFDHLAYCTEAQLAFKESYYGYTGALEKWRSLQMDSRPEIPANEYLNWIPAGIWAIPASAPAMKFPSPVRP